MALLRNTKNHPTWNNSSLRKATQLVDWPWLPWIVSAVMVLIYGFYFFALRHQLVTNDFFGYVWMALEDRENGLGSSTNSVIPAGYPILLNLFHAFGLNYMNAGRLLTLVAAIPLLSLVWIGASRWGEVPWAGPIAWLLTATSYHFILTAATPLPDLIALSLTIPMVVLSLKPDRSPQTLVFSAFFAGLACGIRYFFIESVVPLAILLLLFSHPSPWRKRLRDGFFIIAGLIVGLLPEIIFALRAGHVPFQNSSKYYLTVLVGEADFSMTGTKFRNMPSTFEYVRTHIDKVLTAWSTGYAQNFGTFVVIPTAIWLLAEGVGKLLKKEKVKVQIRRELILLLVFEAILLIPFSSRQPLPYYVRPLLLCFSFMIAAIPIVTLAGINKATASAVVICLCVFSISQVRSAMLTLPSDDPQWFAITSGDAGQENLFADQKFRRMKLLDAYKKHIPPSNRQITFNSIVARELYSLGVRDSVEVLNLVAPFELYWPYGDRSPLLYYTAKEPGWLSLTNTFRQKRPFIYEITKTTVSRFRIVLTRPLSFADKDEFLSGFEFVKQIGRVQIYKSAQ